MRDLEQQTANSRVYSNRKLTEAVAQMESTSEGLAVQFPASDNEPNRGSRQSYFHF